MSASTASSATDVDIGADTDAPPQLSALFLIRFDKKVGYTVSWSRTTTPIALSNAVEFKSLPSGLHTLSSDLVYFVHEGYAGLSAFSKGAASAAERNAAFVSVGILVSRSYGRLGRSWLLAGRLQKLAKTIAEQVHEGEEEGLESTTVLEEFWEEQREGATGATDGDDTGAGAEARKGRKRALSTITAVVPSERGLAPDHPALSMLEYVNVLGPLVFRLQEAALLRKRILFVGGPPVRTCCEFVYNLSVLSSIPPHAAELLSPGTEALLRLPALFSVGVHDIPELERLRGQTQNGNASPDAGKDALSQGWVACTTDEIITSKRDLYDVVVEMPPTYDAQPSKRVWPAMKTANGTQIKASQRDVRRWKMLQRELSRHKRSPTDEEGGVGDDDQAALLRSADADEDDGLDSVLDDTVVEAMTWPHLAYNGFMWWASAGEQHSYTALERDIDRELLGDLSDYADSLPTAVIAYFHRSTTLLIENLNSVIERSDEDEADDEDDGTLLLDKDDVSRMGLDTWSEADNAFLTEFSWMWCGRLVDVRGRSIDCCGVRIPVF